MREWIDKLKALFFDPAWENLDIEAAMALKHQHIPNRLFKFRSINRNALENLKTNSVWCGRASDLNDPYDSSLCFHFSQEFLAEEFKNAMKQLARKKEIFRRTWLMAP